MKLHIAFLSFLSAALLWSASASADPTAPVTIVPAPADQSNIWATLLKPVPDNVVREEYIVSGEVDVFTYNDLPVPGEKVLRNDVETEYTTRIMIIRPPDPADFNGTVVVEWWNSTAGFDTAPSGDASIGYFAREGIIYVGVTNSPTSIDYLAGGCSLFGVLPPMCAERYPDVSMPEIGQAFEMVSQIVNLLRGDSPDNPLGDVDIQRLYHVGQSQQGGSIVTYANEFDNDQNDGYFVQAAGSSARALSSGAPNFAQGEEGRMIRTDLDVPVIRAQTETDMSGVIARDSRQEDTQTFRYYEMAGTAHSSVHDGIEIIPGVFLEDLCRFQMNTLADGPIFGSYLYNAMWRNMEWYSRWRIAMPHGELLLVEDGALALNEFGNSIDGIRVPAMDVPIATYGPNNEGKPVCGSAGAPPPPDCTNALFALIGGLACRLSGTVMPFDEATIDELYPSNRKYVAKVSGRGFHLMLRCFLLHEDFDELVQRAIDSGIGEPSVCGHGFEVALVVPPLVLIGGRVRRRRRRAA